MDQIPERAVRFYYGLPRTAPIVGMMGDMGWVTSVVRHDMKSVRLYNQIAKMPSESTTKKVFEMNRQNAYPNSWPRNLESN